MESRAGAAGLDSFKDSIRNPEFSCVILNSNTAAAAHLLKRGPNKSRCELDSAYGQAIAFQLPLYEICMIPSPESACFLWSEVSWTLDCLCWTLACDWIMRILYLCIGRLIGYQGSGLIIKVSHSWSTDFCLAL